MMRAVAYFTFKYGRIDWLESNNEYWLTQDARLRTDFHITSGFQLNEIEIFKSKKHMEGNYYKKGRYSGGWSVTKLALAKVAFRLQQSMAIQIVVKPE